MAARDDWPGGDDGPGVRSSTPPAASRPAHELGLAHGDPSAEQIWLDEDGVVKLGGIGLTTMPGAETRDGAEPFARSASRDVQITWTDARYAVEVTYGPSRTTRSPRIRRS